MVMLMFVDNLLLFSHEDLSSVGILKSYLETFSSLSGPYANPLKFNYFVSCSLEAGALSCFRLGNVRYP